MRAGEWVAQRARAAAVEAIRSSASHSGMSGMSGMSAIRAIGAIRASGGFYTAGLHLWHATVDVVMGRGDGR